MIYKFDLVPCPKPRQTQADRWKKRPRVLRYREFADKLREMAASVHFDAKHLNGASYGFVLPMPESWSAKKKSEMRFRQHQEKPDLDNLLKAVWDALAKEDCAIHCIGSAEKSWGDRGQLLIVTTE